MRKEGKGDVVGGRVFHVVDISSLRLPLASRCNSFSFQMPPRPLDWHTLQYTRPSLPDFFPATLDSKQRIGATAPSAVVSTYTRRMGSLAMVRTEGGKGGREGKRR